MVICCLFSSITRNRRRAHLSQSILAIFSGLTWDTVLPMKGKTIRWNRWSPRAASRPLTFLMRRGKDLGACTTQGVVPHHICRLIWDRQVPQLMARSGYSVEITWLTTWLMLTIPTTINLSKCLGFKTNRCQLCNIISPITYHSIKWLIIPSLNHPQKFTPNNNNNSINITNKYTNQRQPLN